MNPQASTYAVFVVLAALAALPVRAEETSAGRQLVKAAGGHAHSGHDHGAAAVISIENQLAGLQGLATDASVAQLDSAVIFPLQDRLLSNQAEVDISGHWIVQQRRLIRAEIASCGIPSDSITDERLDGWAKTEHAGGSHEESLVQLAGALRKCSEETLVSVGSRIGGVGKHLSEIERALSARSDIVGALTESRKARADLLERDGNTARDLPRTRGGLEARIAELQEKADLWKGDVEMMSLRAEEAFAALKADLQGSHPAAAEKLTREMVEPFALDYWNGFNRMGELEDRLEIPRGQLAAGARHDLIRQLGWRPNRVKSTSGMTLKAVRDSLSSVEEMLQAVR